MVCYSDNSNTSSGRNRWKEPLRYDITLSSSICVFAREPLLCSWFVNTSMVLPLITDTDSWTSLRMRFRFSASSCESLSIGSMYSTSTGITAPFILLLITTFLFRLIRLRVFSLNLTINDSCISMGLKVHDCVELLNCVCSGLSLFAYLDKLGYNRLWFASNRRHWSCDSFVYEHTRLVYILQLQQWAICIFK